MKVFILEDDNRRLWMMDDLGLLKGCTITRAESCLDAHKFQPPYDLILLDHDLGGRQLKSHEDNGYTFVKLILEKIPDNTPILIHSYNPDGAENMRNALQDAGHFAILAPFLGKTFIQNMAQIRDRFYAQKMGNPLE